MSGGWVGSDRKERLPSNWNSTIRPAILARDPICVLCGVRPSCVADHIKAKTDDHRPAALQGVCGPCHDHKSGVEGNEAKAAKPGRTRPQEVHPGLL